MAAKPKRAETERRLTSEELAAYNARRLSPEERAAWDAAHPRRGLPVVERPEEIPAGMTLEEARAFWDTHEPGEGLVRAAEASERPRAPGRGVPKVQAPISLRLEADTVRRLRALAAKKGTEYQTLLKTFVQERLYEEEKREGLVEAG
jgi:hypothetical protein